MASPSEIASHILDRFGAGDLLRVLTTELSASELASVLLVVHRARSEAAAWPKILEQFERTAMFQPSAADVARCTRSTRCCFLLRPTSRRSSSRPSPLSVSMLAREFRRTTSSPRCGRPRSSPIPRRTKRCSAPRAAGKIATPWSSARFPEAAVAFDETRTRGRKYYDGYCLKIEVKDRDGVSLPLGDGGFTSWTRALLSDQKERFFSSAIGTELIVKRFRSI